MGVVPVTPVNLRFFELQATSVGLGDLHVNHQHVRRRLTVRLNQHPHRVDRVQRRLEQGNKAQEDFFYSQKQLFCRQDKSHKPTQSTRQTNEAQETKNKINTDLGVSSQAGKAGKGESVIDRVTDAAESAECGAADRHDRFKHIVLVGKDARPRLQVGAYPE